MPNVFDYFDKADAPAGNPFDQFDATDAPTKITVRPADAQPKTTAGEAFGGGVLNSAVLGFRDELHGLARAGGLDPDDPNVANALVALVKGAYRKASGDPDAERLYGEQVGQSRATTALQEKEHPAAALGGNIAGAVMLPVGAAAQAATLPARIGRGAAVGAGVGGVAGFGGGEGLAGSVKGAAIGVPLGGAIGAVAPPLVEGALQAGRAVTAPLRNAVRGAVAPETEAARRVTNAISRDVQRDPTGAPGLTPQEFTNTPPATLMDLGGERTRALARSAANTSPEGRAALEGAINPRYEGQADRVTGWLENVFNYPNAQAQQQALEQTARTVNRGAYARAYREGDRQVWSPELERLTSSPDVVQAMRDAATKGKSRAVAEGFGGFNPGVTVDNGGIVSFQRGANGQPTYPNLQYWDAVKRSLDDATNSARRAGRNEEASTLGNLTRQLRSELDRAVPSYGAARAGAAHFFGADNALEAGQNFVTASFGNREARAALGRMSDQERQLFQDGFVSRFVETLNKTGDRRNVLNKIADSPHARERLEIALGRQRANELEAGLRIEGILDRARPAVQGNSTTARQLTELGLAGGAGSVGGVGAYNQDPQQITYAAIAGALLGGRRFVDQRVARRVAEMLVSNDPAVLQRGIRHVGRSENMMDALRAADRRLAVTGSEQAAQ